MANADARIRIKLGSIEIEYEGSASYLRDELLETLKKIVELQSAQPAIAIDPSAGSHRAGEAKTGNFNHSTDTIATIIKAATGPDLVIAASAHPHFVQGRTQFTRQEITAAMRTAPAHFKETYFSNLSASLKTLTKADRLRLHSKDTYALSANETQELEKKLANN